MPDIIASFRQIAPYINSLTISDTAVYVSNRETYLTVIGAATFSLPVRVGDSIVAGSVVEETMLTGQPVRRKVPADFLGVPYIACGIPIKDHGQVLGSVVFVTSIQQEEHIETLASDLSTALTQVSDSSANIDKSAEDLVQVYEALSQTSETLNRYILETDKVLKVIEGFARQTNLLGLNASVEAARAGSAGKGFSVIANETRKLAVNTSSSATKIEEIFERIKSAAKDQTQVIDKINHIVVAQRESVKSVYNLVQDLNEDLETLVNDTKNLKGTS